MQFQKGLPTFSIVKLILNKIKIRSVHFHDGKLKCVKCSSFLENEDPTAFYCFTLICGKNGYVDSYELFFEAQSQCYEHKRT